MGAIDARLDDLLRRLLAPERPRADECLAIVDGCASGDEAWERLCARGVIEPSFALEAHRTFAAPVRKSPADSHTSARCTDARCLHCAPGVWLSTALRAPATVLAAATVASDPDGITTAEHLARECAARLGLVAPTTFHWMVADRPALVWTAPSLATLSSSGVLPWEHWNDDVPDPYKLRFDELGLFDDALDAWLVAVAVGAYSSSASTTALAPFSALWRSGYALRALEGDVAILGAPLVSPEFAIVCELPDEAASMRRAMFGDERSNWLSVKAFETTPRTDDGVLDLRTSAIDRSIGTWARWQSREPSEWCAQMANRFRWLTRSPSEDAIAAAIDRLAPGSRALLQASDNNRALSRALVGYDVRWSDTAAIVTDSRIFTITTWYED